MILILVGPPGAGKGTVSQELSEKHGYVHFSMGQALRDHVEQKGKFASKIKKVQTDGHLVPDSIISFVLQDELSHHFAKTKHPNILLDGFPRNVHQTRLMRKIFSSRKWDIDGVLFLDASKRTIWKRLKVRLQCAICGRIYGLHVPPKKKGMCDDDKGKLVRRADDTKAIFEERYRIYEKETLPVVEYAAGHFPVVRIDGNARLPVMVKRVEKAFAFLSHLPHKS